MQSVRPTLKQSLKEAGGKLPTLGRLKLKVNQEKSSVKRINRTTPLGFGFYKKSRGPISLRIAPKTLRKVKMPGRIRRRLRMRL
jgi:hypothetical protein